MNRRGYYESVAFYEVVAKLVDANQGVDALTE